MWIILVLFYGIVKGIRDVIKKKALTKNTVMEVLFVYTLLAFLFCIPEIPKAGGLPGKYYFLIAIKSFVIFVAWILSFNAIDKVPISIYGIIDLSRIIFSTAFGILILKEKTSLGQISGLIFIILGLLVLKLYPAIQEKRSRKLLNDTSSNTEKSIGFEKEEIPTKYIIAIFVSCILNATSGCLDKIYCTEISSSQLQFWYMLYLVVFYGLYFVIKRIGISLDTFKNVWIWALSILFFLGDKALFIANENPSSKVSVMTLIKQSSCLVTIVAGKYVFKEKNIAYKLFCAMIILFGIIISVL